jgi:hypothetical protein
MPFTMQAVIQEDMSSTVRTDQQWMQLYLFLFLSWAYLLPLNEQSVPDAPFYVQLVGRTILLILGCIGFHLALGERRTGTLVDSKASLDFYALQQWGSLHTLEGMSEKRSAWPLAPSNGGQEALQGGLWWWSRLLLESLKAALQLWMALHSAKWFQIIVHMVTSRLLHLELDLRGRHAADLDDIHFSLALAYIFAASYVATPSSANGGWHSFALMWLLGIQNTVLFIIWLVHTVPSLFSRCRRG